MDSGQGKKSDNMVGRVFGSCIIEEKIAVGGFGTVYKAIDQKLKIPRAIKIFHPHLSEEKGFRKRFEIEMRLLACLDHPNIVKIINAIDEEDVSGFIMEYVEGKTLDSITEEEGALSSKKALDIFLPVASSIAYAHNLGNQIIHRDLSPDNIMIRPDGVVKIMDFGIAKTIGSERVTQTGIVLGKPLYMAPEQFEGTVSVFTDQYALGIILYEMATGKLPFDAESPIALYKLHLSQSPPAPRELNSKISPQMEQVILKALSKQEENRYPNMDDLILALMGKQSDRVDTTTAKMIFQIDEMVEQENYQGAFDVLDQVEDQDPDNKEIGIKREEVKKLQKSHQDQDLMEECYYQAKTFFERGMEDEACNYTLNFLKLSYEYPQNSLAQNCKENLSQSMNNIFTRAQTIAEEQVHKVSKYTKEGKDLLQKKRFTDALQCFKKGLQLHPNSEELNDLRLVSERQIRIRNATELYNQALQEFQGGNYAKATLTFESVLEMDPRHEGALKYRDLSKSEQEKQEKSKSEAETIFQKGVQLYEKWEYTRALEMFEKVIELDATHNEAQMMLNRSQERLQDEDRIEEIGFFYNQGLTFYKSQQWEKAITCFERVLKHMDSHKGALEYSRLAQEKVAQKNKIDVYFQEALEMFRKSKYEEASAKLETILKWDKSHKGAKQYKALCQELQSLAQNS